MKSKTFFFLLSVFLSLSLMITLAACKKKDKKEETQFHVEKTKQIPKEDVEKREGKSDLKELAITTYPTNGQNIRNLEQDIIIYFSREMKPDDFSFKIYPDPGEWKTSWKNMGRQVDLQHSNPFSAAVDYKLEIIVRPENIKKTIQFIAYGPSTLQKIEEDEAKGLIDLDTAWLYRLQALFETKKLPTKYQSSTPYYCGTKIMRDFQLIANKLKPQTLQNLNLYLVRPDHPDSVFAYKQILPSDKDLISGIHPIPFVYGIEERPSGVEKKPIYCKTAPISIWFMKDYKDKAESSRSYLDMGNYYGLFKELLGKEPLSDGNLKSIGEDGRLDIYLVPIGSDREDTVWGLCRPLQGGKTGPALILIDISLEGADLDATLAHELFHAFQFAFDQNEDDWWMEGTAVWAEDLSDPHRDSEQEYLDGVFFKPEHRLETLTDEDDYHEYSIYLFPYYLSSEFGNEKIAEIWRSCENTDALDAVDSSVAKGLDGCFKKFALHNLDLGPYEGSYVDAKGPLELYDYHGAFDFYLLSVGEESQNFPLPPLSARYIMVENLFDPDNAPPFVRFDLEDFANNDKITIQAIIDPEEKAIEEDWSNLSERTFCINLEEDHFKRIALVIASSERESTVFPDLSVAVKEEGCEADWSGTFSFSYSHKSKKAERFSWGTETILNDIHESGSVSLVFFYDEEYGDYRCRGTPGGSYMSSYKKELRIATNDGKARTVDTCNCSGPYADEGPDARCFLSLIGNNYQLSIILSSNPDKDCDGTTEKYVQGMLVESHEFAEPFVLTESFEGKTDGNTITGSKTNSGEGWMASYNWILRAHKKK